MKKIYLLLVAVATVMTFMACHKEKEEKDSSNPNYPNYPNCSIPPYRDFGFHRDKEDSALVNFKNELSIYKISDQGKERVDMLRNEGHLYKERGVGDYVCFLAVIDDSEKNGFRKRENIYSLEGAGIAVKLTIRVELTKVECGTNIHIYEVLLNDKKWEPTIDENKTLIYTLKSSMFTVK